MPTKTATLRDYILEWLYTRNGGELADAFDNMRVRDRRLLQEELDMILEHGGKPPNWHVSTVDANTDTIPPVATVLSGVAEGIPKHLSDALSDAQRQALRLGRLCTKCRQIIPDGERVFRDIKNAVSRPVCGSCFGDASMRDGGGGLLKPRPGLEVYEDAKLPVAGIPKQPVAYFRPNCGCEVASAGADCDHYISEERYLELEKERDRRRCGGHCGYDHRALGDLGPMYHRDRHCPVHGLNRQRKLELEKKLAARAELGPDDVCGEICFRGTPAEFICGLPAKHSGDCHPRGGCDDARCGRDPNCRGNDPSLRDGNPPTLAGKVDRLGGR